ncbi:hypothetical protein OS175_13330 [Marinicella sp. S1101]|uniref:hypothetical protein n=1 Tax=Marinicella marina TaxID=2996016 RepID=UPI002260EE45|nr:hypothetical protein [Marinicella marina]MCX7554856.1 hypothetical protein [Marinicella marina]MDJ1141514.1 hypothetical protein [Marinicella marina]
MKYGILLTVILAIALIWYFTQDQLPEQTNDQTQATTPEKVDPSLWKNDSAPIEPLKEPVETPTTNQTQMPEAGSEYWPEGQTFHQDPVIDAFMGMIEYSLCNEYMSPDKNNGINVSDLSEQQKDHLMSHFKQCEAQQEQIKNYSKQKLLAKMSEPEFRKRFEAFFSGAETYTPEQVVNIYSEINKKTGMELLITANMYKRFFQQEITPKVKAQLQAHDQAMVEYVIKQSSFLVACERGADCSADSALMNNMCLEYEQGCGLDFNTFVNTHYIPGIRNEIQITKNLLKNLFNFN